MLPHESGDFDQERLLDELSRLAADLTPAFLDAANTSVWFGVNQVSGVISAGALQDLDGFESVVDAAVQVLTPTPEASLEITQMRLAIDNGEIGDDFVEQWETNDEGYTAQQYLSDYVDRVRATRPWGQLLRHRHRKQPLLLLDTCALSRSTVTGHR